MVSLLLASQSPRRRELIALVGLMHEATVSGVDEDLVWDADPVVNTRETARLKAQAVAKRLEKKGKDGQRVIVVAADTTVVVDGRLLGKPANPKEATAMLALLRGRSHQVHTGLTLIDVSYKQEFAAVQTSVVTMRDYSDTEIAAYVASGDPLDKAGAYGIQHPVFKPVARLDGCFTGVMGLSVCHLIQALQAWGIPVRAQETAVTQAHRHYPCPLLAEIRPILQP